MAETFSILSQTDPAAATVTDAFTATGQTVVSAVYIANRSAVATAFRVSVAPAGAADAVVQYLYYDIAIAGNDTFQFGPIGLENTDKIRVYATLATLTFTVTGLEIT